MKKSALLAIAILCVTATYAQKTKKSSTKEKTVEVIAPKTVTEITSYALGANVADGLKQNSSQYGITVDWEWVIKGLKEASEGKNQFDEAKMKEAFGKLDSLVQEHNKLKAKDQKEYLEKNAKREGVIVTPSGLQYEVVRMGKGAKPTATDKVKVQYEGKTIDGKVFDSSYQRGEPATFPLANVIAGWVEGIQLMPVGSKFMFYIPSELAYGERGAGGMIEPHATLIFEVELLEINPKEEEHNEHDGHNHDQPTIQF